MFGLTKREQRWKAEQKAAETIACVLVAAINAKSHKGEEMNKSEQLIACLEGEIAKRDEELAACRVAVENCEVFRVRIAELEARIVWLECEALEEIARSETAVGDIARSALAARRSKGVV